MSGRLQGESQWLDFDVHGMLGIRVETTAPAAAQLRQMLNCFHSQQAVPADLVVTPRLETFDDVSSLEQELRYTASSVELVEEQVQVVRDGDGRYRIHGAGELLTALVPVLDRAMVERGAAMIHAATVAYRGQAVALPAGGGTGKTSTVAKLVRREGFSFMGDDWAFLTETGQLLGYEKPMFIKPHHKPIYPHLFTGARKPTLPVALSRPVGRLTTVVHPTIIKYPRVADLARRWSPEHRMVDAARALPGVPVTRAAPLLTVMYVERFLGNSPVLEDRSSDWMVDRMMGNFHIEMASFSQTVLAAWAAASVLSWRELVADKAAVLSKALDGVECRLLRVPVDYSADQASDEVVRAVEGVVGG